MNDITHILKNQRDYFNAQSTKDIRVRLANLKKLENAIKANEEQILQALQKDLHKPEFEAYSTELGLTLRVLKHTQQKLRKWMKPRGIASPLFLFGSHGRVYPEPYGQVLIIGPFNFPWLLCIEPLISALAAGNTVIVKPSRNTPHIAACICHILSTTFPPELVTAIAPDSLVPTADLIHLNVDYIFFTGSVRVGKIVMAAAAENLIPVTLELGGKSPVIIDTSAKLNRAVERICYAKFSNSGQICVAPDYVYVHEDIAHEFIERLRKCILSFYGKDPQLSQDYGRIVSKKELERLVGLLDDDKIVHGGKYNMDDRYLEPTLMYPADWTDEVMKDEIFGSILPILPYTDIDQVFDTIKKQPKPLAAYMFTENPHLAKRFIQELSFGSGCINEALMQVAADNLPFGGVGNSGMGRYHGKYSFQTFSHEKPILKRSTAFSIRLAYPPYKSLKLLKKFI